MIRTLLLLTYAAALYGQKADEIMAKVAANQDRSADARKEYVYHQNLLIHMNRANGKLAREEVRDYTVTPGADGVKRELVHLSGKIGKGKRVIDYDNPDYRHGNVDIDGEIVQGFADGFGVNEKSKDGVNHDLFPLRTEKLQIYQFTLTGEEKWHQHDAFHIEFKPKKTGIEDDCWAGEALIDKTEFEPLLISTHLACKIPVLVKTLLGTNVRQVGFKVTYERFEDGVWFPVTYGGEFQFRAVFMYARSVGIGLVNSDFKRTRVDTAIKYETPSQ